MCSLNWQPIGPVLQPSGWKAETWKLELWNNDFSVGSEQTNPHRTGPGSTCMSHHHHMGLLKTPHGVFLCTWVGKAHNQALLSTFHFLSFSRNAGRGTSVKRGLLSVMDYIWSPTDEKRLKGRFHVAATAWALIWKNPVDFLHYHWKEMQHDSWNEQALQGHLRGFSSSSCHGFAALHSSIFLSRLSTKCLIRADSGPRETPEIFQLNSSGNGNLNI